MNKEEKKTVIITGGNRGIGEYISRCFAHNGYNVLIAARTDTGLSKELGSCARFKETDVRDESAHKSLAEAALEWTNRLDVYINCAGFSRWSAVEKVDEKFWSKMIDTNLKGVFWGCKTASLYLTKGGSIINISSLAGKRGSANNSVYCASKFGVTGITQALAKELGPKGIRVNAVCPVYIETEGLISALKEEYSPVQGESIEGYLHAFAKSSTALKRLPTAEEVAAACLFLASESASGVTGQSINVDCGTAF